MITVSIRFNYCLVRWIIDCAHHNKISISEFIRDLLYEKIRHGELEFNRVKLDQKQPTPPNYRSRLRDIVFAAKLVERFVITTEDNGEEMRDQAFQETKELLEVLSFSDTKNKDRQLCISLDQQLYSWMKSEAVRLKVKTASLIRNIIENAYVSAISNLDDNTVSSIQTIGAESQLLVCKLLESFITETVEGGDTIIEEVRKSTNNFLNKMSSEKQLLVS